jgi:hypothetical protein
MNTKEVKAKIHENADRIERGVEAAAAGLANGAETMSEQRDEVLDQLRDIGRRLSDSAKMLTDEAAKQARLRPLAVFGAAFAVGAIVALAFRHSRSKR